MGREKGVREEQLHDLADYQKSPHFSELERLALRLADHMAATPAAVPSELYQALRAHLDEAQMVELATAIAWESYRARFNRVFEIGSDNFSEGAFCAIPAPNRLAGTTGPVP